MKTSSGLPRDVCQMLNAAISERESLSESWAQSRRDYENQPYPYVSNYIQGAADIPFPFAFIRAEALGDHVVTSITNQSPVVKAHVPGGDQSRAERLEKAVNWFLTLAGFNEVLKTLTSIVWWSNAGIIRVAYGDPRSPIRLDAISPDDFVVIGSGAYDISDSDLVGHRFYRSLAEIDRMIESGVYQSAETRAFPTVGGSNESDSSSLVELYQLYVWCDPTGNDRFDRWSIVIEPHTESILSIERYPFQTPCYFAFRYKPSPERGFWHPRPLGADMQGPHRAYQCLSNLALYGVAMSALPPLVAQRGAFSRDQRYGPGVMVNVEAGDVTTPQARVELGALQAELARIERVGDGVARVNSSAAGMEAMRTKTATQASYEMAGMMAGISGYLETFTTSIQSMCFHVCEVLAATYDEWHDYHSNIASAMLEDFRAPVRWDVPGKIPNLNPSAIVANIQTIMGIISNTLPIASSMGPQGLEMVISLIETAMNAMDFPNPDSVIAPLRAMLEPQPNAALGPQANAILGPQQGVVGPSAGLTNEQLIPPSEMGATTGVPDGLATILQSLASPQIGDVQQDFPNEPIIYG